MRHEIEPFAIPTQQACPHLVFPVRQYLLLEETGYASQSDYMASPCAVCCSHGAFQRSFFRAVEPAVLFDAVADYSCEQVGARYVHVGEVRAVGLVQIVVGFEQGRAGRGNDGLEERVWRDGRWLEVDVVYESAEDAYLRLFVSYVGVLKKQRRNVHAIRKVDFSGLPMLVRSRLSSKYHPAHCILSIVLAQR
jgi:hypothetical protein